jgi:hypothetical protein
LKTVLIGISPDDSSQRKSGLPDVFAKNRPKVRNADRTAPGLPDEFAKKLTKISPNLLFIEVNTLCSSTVEKSSPKIWATCVIFKKYPKVNSRPIGENWPNMFTLDSSEFSPIGRLFTFNRF